MGGADIAFIGALVALLAAIAGIDLAQRRIPDRLNLMLGAVGLARALYRVPTAGTLIGALASAALTGAAVIAAAAALRRSGREAELGAGDIKFLLAAQFWVGFDGSIVVMTIAGIATLVGIALVRPWRRFALEDSIALGPMLSLGLLLVVARGS